MTPVTPDVTLAEVRARLEQMVQMCLAVQAQALHYPEGPLVERLAAVWSLLPTGVERFAAVWSSLPTEACYIDAASPDLLLRVAREALSVLDRHRLKERSWNPVLWCGCCGVWVEWPCPEVTSVLRAWRP